MSRPHAQDGPSPTRAAFGRELAYWREQRGKTQAGLARRLVEEHWLQECSQSYIAHVEAGRRPPPRGMAEGADVILATGGALARLWPWVDQEEQARRQQRAVQAERASRRRALAAVEDGGKKREKILAGAEPLTRALEEVGLGLQDGPADVGHGAGYAAPFPVVFSDGRIGYMRLPRRMFLAIGGTGLAGAMTGPFSLTADDLDRLDLAIETPERVDLPMVGYFRAILADHRRADDLLGPQHLRFPVLVQLAMVERFIKSAKGDVKRELQRVGAEYAQLAWWLALDAGDLASARRHWDRARGLALDAGDHGLIGYLFARRVTEIWHTTRDVTDARDMAEAARRPEYRMTPAVTAEAGVRAACAAALAGSLDECRDQLDQAKTSIRGTDAEQEPPWIYWVDEGAIAHSAGAYFDWLGRPDLALPEFERALELLPVERTRERGEVLAGKSAAHAAAGTPEEAGAVGAEALDLAEQTGSSRSLDRLRLVDERLARWSTLPAVRDFHDRYIATVGPARG